MVEQAIDYFMESLFTEYAFLMYGASLVIAFLNIDFKACLKVAAFAALNLSLFYSLADASSFSDAREGTLLRWPAYTVSMWVTILIARTLKEFYFARKDTKYDN